MSGNSPPTYYASYNCCPGGTATMPAPRRIWQWPRAATPKMQFAPTGGRPAAGKTCARLHDTLDRVGLSQLSRHGPDPAGSCRRHRRGRRLGADRGLPQQCPTRHTVGLVLPLLRRLLPVGSVRVRALSRTDGSCGPRICGHPQRPTERPTEPLGADGRTRRALCLRLRGARHRRGRRFAGLPEDALPRTWSRALAHAPGPRAVFSRGADF